MGYPTTRQEMIRNMQAEVRAVNELNGWFDNDRTVLEGHMLLVTEIAEASDAFREMGMTEAFAHDHDREGEGIDWISGPEGEPCENCVPKPLGVGSEYADVLIRLLDQCDRDGIDLIREYERKLNHNRVRGYRHGGKSI